MKLSDASHEDKQFLPVAMTGQTSIPLKIVSTCRWSIAVVCTYSPFDTQTEHLYNYWLGFPPSSSSLFIISYSFSPSSCWLTPSPHFLLSIIHPAFAFLLNHVHIICLPLFSLWPSQGSSCRTADTPPVFFSSCSPSLIWPSWPECAELPTEYLRSESTVE